MKTKQILYLTVMAILVVGLGVPFSASAAQQPYHLIVVTSLADDGSPGTLRYAMDEANSDVGPTRIEFDRALKGGTIVLAWSLPDLHEDATTIDGLIGSDHRPAIEISAGPEYQGWSLISIRSSYNTVRGLALNSSPGDGIYISGSYNIVEYCNVGTDLSSTLDKGNNGSGIMLGDGASDNRIGPGNLIAYNARGGGPNGGVAVLDGFKWEYWPEFQGLAPDYSGIFEYLDFPGTGGAFTSIDGIVPLGGDGHPFADTFAARFTGLMFAPVEGTYTFAVDYPDDILEVHVDGVLVIEAGCGTPYGCNPHSETYFLTQGVHDMKILFQDGPGAAGFALKILGESDISYTTYEGEPGLRGEFFQLRIPSERNRITRNSIHSNFLTGIELDALDGWWSLNEFDPGDGDVGPNTSINYPVLETAVTNPGRMIVTGYVDTGNPRPLIVEFFAGPPYMPGEPYALGETVQYLGKVNLVDTSTFSAVLPPVPAGMWITATLTDALGNTSDISLPVEVMPR